MNCRELLRALAGALLIAAPAVAQTGGTVESGIERLAEQIVARSAAADRTTIAISSFPHVDDSCSELSNFLVDELVLSLFGVPESRLSIIERSQLSRIFAELELSMSGAVDMNTTRELGRIHGVETLLVGSLTTIGDDLRINARLIDTETGQVFSAAAVNIPRTSTIEDLMRRPAAGGCTMMPSGGPRNINDQRGLDGLNAANAFELSLPAIDDDFHISMLVGRWRGQLQCPGNVGDRRLDLSKPTILGLVAEYRDTSRNRVSHHTLSYDFSGGDIGNSFILSLTEAGLPLKLVSPEVLFGEWIIDGKTCQIFLAKES